MNLPIPFLKLSMPILGSSILLLLNMLLAQVVAAPQNQAPPPQSPDQVLQSTINNVLLGGVVVLLAWSLINTRRTEKKVEKVVSVLEGWDGKTGMIHEIAELNKKIVSANLEISKLWGKINHLRRTGIVSGRDDGE